MGMTITEKILAKASGRTHCEPGNNIWINTDVLMIHDLSGPGTIGVFKREFGEQTKVWDKEKVIVIPDHYIFTKDEMCHRNIDMLRSFAKEQNLKYFYNPGTSSYSGIAHNTLPEKGHCRPGEVLLGADSHICTAGSFAEFAIGIGNTDAGFAMGTGKIIIKVPATMKFIIDGQLPMGVTAKDIILQIIGDITISGATYRTMEFVGSTIDALNLDERMTICNMVVEAGAKNGIIAADEKTKEYVKQKTNKPFECFYSDDNAKYLSIHKYNAAMLEPIVALPYRPDNIKKVKELSDYKINRAYIGSCTGGKLTDFLMAAQILKDKKVHVETYLVPATVEIENELKNTKIDGKTPYEIFQEAGCMEPAPPSCAACLGGPIDTYGRCNGNEVCISTTNRNFHGRMGSKNSTTILASPLTVAASAVTGYITDPRKFM